MACTLRGAHNRRNAVNKLPPELLGHIFGFTTDNDFLPLQTAFSTRDVTALHSPTRSIILVCRYWRHVAINTAALWSFIAIASSGQSYYETILQHSKLYPLTVYCDSRIQSSLRQSPFFAKVMSHMNRIHDLRVFHLVSWPQLPIMFTDALQLKTMVIEIESSTDLGDDATTELDTWCTPCLANLSIQGFSCQWTNTTWGSLRCLSVGYCSLRSVTVVKQFLDFVDSMSSTLEELVLSYVNIHGHGASAPLNGYREEIRMLRLRRVTIEATSAGGEILSILAPRLVLPDICSQQIHTDESMHQLAILSRASCYNPGRLFIDGRRRVGVRGSSAFYVHNHAFKHLVSDSSPFATLEELWLFYRYVRMDGPRRVGGCLPANGQCTQARPDGSAKHVQQLEDDFLGQHPSSARRATHSPIPEVERYYFDTYLSGEETRHWIHCSLSCRVGGTQGHGRS